MVTAATSPPETQLPNRLFDGPASSVSLSQNSVSPCPIRTWIMV